MQTERETKSIVANPASTILPEQIQMELLELRENFKKGYFKIGDIAADVITVTAEFGITNQEVFNEIGKFCGKSARTVRYYYETAVFFPQSIRDQYDVLPFSHFVFARSVQDWQSVLEYAKEKPYAGEEELRRQFIGTPPCISDYVSSDNEQSDEREQREQPERLQPDQQHYDADQKKVIDRHRYLQMVSGLRESIKVIDEILERDDIDGYDRMRLTDSYYELDSVANFVLGVVEKL